MIFDRFETALEVFAAGVAARPWLFAFVGATAVLTLVACFHVSEHRGWRAACWALAAACTFALGMALPV